MDCSPKLSELREQQAGIGCGPKGSARAICPMSPSQFTRVGTVQGVDSPWSMAAMLLEGREVGLHG